jgi:hypothetical protein
VTTTLKVAVPKRSAATGFCLLASSLATTVVSSACAVGVLLIVITALDAVASELPVIAAATISDPAARALPCIVRTYHGGAPKSSHYLRARARGQRLARRRLIEVGAVIESGACEVWRVEQSSHADGLGHA